MVWVSRLVLSRRGGMVGVGRRVSFLWGGICLVVFGVGAVSPFQGWVFFCGVFTQGVALGCGTVLPLRGGMWAPVDVSSR